MEREIEAQTKKARNIVVDEYGAAEELIFASDEDRYMSILNEINANLK